VALAGGLGDRSDPGLGGEVLHADEAGAIVAELGQDLGGDRVAGTSLP